MSSRYLAIEGGAPVWERPMGAWPVFDEPTIAAVADVLRSGRVNYWTGEEGTRFESEYAESLGVRHAIALSNGTAALELALRAVGIQPGDEVIVPARTFIATASSVVMCGARPVIADIDPLMGNLTAATVREVMSERTRAVIPVHVAGCPCEMDELMALACERGWWVIEDCAQAHGARYHRRPVGSLGHLAAFSFCQDKILTTGGEGGLLVTDDEKLYRKAWEYKDHGKNFYKVRETGHPPLFRYLHDSFGTNLRMTEMQAAIGRQMLQKLPGWVTQRRSHAKRLDDRLQGVPGLDVLQYPEHLEHAFYKYYVQVVPEALAPGWSRDELILAIRAEGISCGSGSCSEIYREKAFRSTERMPLQPLPFAQHVGERSLMLLVHPTLTSAEIDATAEAVRKVMEFACQTPLRRSSQAA